MPLLAIENLTAGRAPGGMMFAGTNESVESLERYPVAMMVTDRSESPCGAFECEAGAGAPEVFPYVFVGTEVGSDCIAGADPYPDELLGGTVVVVCVRTVLLSEKGIVVVEETTFSELGVFELFPNPASFETA